MKPLFKKRIIFTILCLAVILIGCEQLQDRSCYAGRPRANATILRNTGFTVGYSDQHKNPLWVSCRLVKVDNPVAAKRPSSFKADKRTISQVKPDDYTHSGYDRGHMAPNYGIATRYGKQAQLETFYMSNICPQKPKLNRGIWERLEEKIADDYANKLEDVWVVTGPVFDNQREYLPSGVEIPDAFYKIVVDEVNIQPRMLAVIIPQDVAGGAQLDDFIVSIDSVESITGIDFFTELDDGVEDSLESIIPEKLW